MGWTYKQVFYRIISVARWITLKADWILRETITQHKTFALEKYVTGPMVNDSLCRFDVALGKKSHKL